MKSLENRRFITLLDKLKDLFIEWCKSSTSHGIPNIARAENKIIALVWCLAFTISTGFCGFYILQTIIEVSKNPTMINYEIIEETPAVFPAISICNLNPFKTTNSNVYNTLLNVLLENNFKYTIHPNLASISASSLVKSYVFNLPDEVKKTFSYQYSELVYSCKFNGFLCSSQDFEWFYSFDYGNCYKFNPNGTKMVGKSGSQGGLRLEMYVGNSSDSEAYTIKTGLRFLIHNHTDFRSISNYGQDASAGFSTEVKINRNIHSKLGAPFSNCLEDVTSATKSKSDLMILMFDLLNLTIYTREMCLNVCYQIPLEESCNCSDASIPQIQANLSRCVSSTQIKCQEQFFQNFYSVSNSYCQDQCPKGIL
ncbi:unnamed protein product [Brachionus calyciflorus]|uniref:Uncharacterized protein n=1 Tax=Brachionus calyciflorus TaxID=104777 RepID=A0A813MPX6_9BILA|nr:unnamed protein product [Brachionus calyciflorus]